MNPIHFKIIANLWTVENFGEEGQSEGQIGGGGDGGDGNVQMEKVTLIVVSKWCMCMLAISKPGNFQEM